MNDELLSQLRELLAKAEQEPYVIGLLTDEELVAVEHEDATTPYPLPWLSRNPRRRELAGEFGMRSLLVRGLITPTEPRDDRPSVLDIAPELRIALDTRRLGLGYVRASRPRDDAGISKILVVQPELGCVEEEISLDGLHLFSTCNYADAVARMAHWCLPTAHGTAFGGAVEIAEDTWPEFLYSELPDARVTDLELELFLPDADGRREPVPWLLAYDEHTAMVAAQAGAQRLAVRATTSDKLADQLGERIHEALRYARSA